MLTSNETRNINCLRVSIDRFRSKTHSWFCVFTESPANSHFWKRERTFFQALYWRKRFWCDFEDRFRFYCQFTVFKRHEKMNLPFPARKLDRTNKVGGKNGLHDRFRSTCLLIFHCIAYPGTGYARRDTRIFQTYFWLKPFAMRFWRLKILLPYTHVRIFNAIEYDNNARWSRHRVYGLLNFKNVKRKSLPENATKIIGGKVKLYKS